MGDIAEMMLDGTLCEGCGVSLDGQSPGYPRYCSTTCRKDREPQFVRSPKIRCGLCGKRVKPSGLPDHTRDVHSG